MRVTSMRRFVAVALAVAAFASPAAHASAPSTSAVEATLRRIGQAADPAKAFERLDRDMQAAVVEYLTPANVQVRNYCNITAVDRAEPQDEACYAATMYADYGKDPDATGNAGLATAAGLGDPKAAACVDRWAQITATNKKNRRLFWMGVRFHACVNGTTVVSDAWRYPDTQIYAPFWFDRGSVESHQFGGVGSSYYHTFTLRKFELCITSKLGCIYQSNISADTTVNGTGAWHWEIG